MTKVSRKVAFNVLESFNGQEYVNAYKVSNTLAEKLKNRFARQGTITDRDYTITKYKTSGDRGTSTWRGQLPTPVDLSKYELKDIEQMLADSYDEHWGDPDEAQQNLAAMSQRGTARPRWSTKVRGLSVAPAPKVQPQEPPSEPVAQRAEKVVEEADLRQMTMEEITLLVKTEVGEPIPPECDTTAKVVDWLMKG